MKHTARSLFLCLFALTVLIGLSSIASDLSAQPTTAEASLIDAATGLPVANEEAAPAVVAPWWSGPEVISAVIALATGLIAVWQRNEKKTAQKVAESLVLGIEAATKIPAVAEKEKLIKAKIRTVTSGLGVEPLVYRLVKDLT